MDTATKKVIAKLQKKEDADHYRRVGRITRALKTARLMSDELVQVEDIIERAYGRTKLGRA